MIQRALRGRVLSFCGDPALLPVDQAVQYWHDGMVLIDDGLIAAVGAVGDLRMHVPAAVAVEDHGERLILPGLIDPHIHYPQTQVIASYGAQLIEWLHRYTFPAEAAYGDPEFAATQARFFVSEMLRNGTTTAAVFCSVHPQSVEAFFAESAARNTRMIAGKVMMDRNAPAGLCDNAERSYLESEALLRCWHGRGRQLYAITPRFAVTSGEAQLTAAGALKLAFPDTYVQTHMAENHDEIAEVQRLFPRDENYAAVYRRFGLLGDRSLLGHCIHLSDSELRDLNETGSVAVFCPTSNLFLGSGLFDMARVRAAGVRIGVASDVGGGTSYSMLRTAGEAYKVLQLQRQSWPAFSAFHAITRGNAGVLGLDQVIGSVAVGYEADLIVLDPAATPAMRHRRDAIRLDLPELDRLAEELFLLMTLGDDRAVRTVYVAGVPQNLEIA